MKTAELLILELCEDVDYWKGQALEWERKHSELTKTYNNLLDSSLSHSRQMAGNQLRLLLNMKPEQVEAAVSDSN